MKETHYRRVGTLEQLVYIFQAWLRGQKHLWKNKVCALAMILVGALSTFDGDGTAFVFILFFAVPMLFAKENWIL